MSIFAAIWDGGSHT